MLEDYEGSRTEMMKMLAEQDGPPAYVLRAQRVEESLVNLIRRCEKQKLEYLDMAKTRLGQLGALVDHRWDATKCLVTNANYDQYLAKLFEEWDPQLRVQVEPTDSLRQLRGAMKELGQSFARFNRRWDKYIHEVVLDNVNHERSEYNNYYLVEKSAAFGSDRLAEMGWEPLKEYTREELFEAVPLLTEPLLA